MIKETVHTAFQVVPLRGDMEMEPVPAGTGVPVNVLVAIQSTFAIETPNGSLISAVMTTWHDVLEPMLVGGGGLMVIFVMVGPMVSMMLRVAGPEVPPPGAGVKTVILAEPTVAMSAALIAALSCVAPTNVVGRLALFHRTTDPGTKFVPLTMRVKLGPPAWVEAGLRPVMAGTPGVGVAVGVKVGGKAVAMGVPEGTGVSGGRQRFWNGSKNWPGGHVGVGVKVIVGVLVGVPTFGGRAGNTGVNCGGHDGPGGMVSHRTAGILST